MFISQLGSNISEYASDIIAKRTESCDSNLNGSRIKLIELQRTIHATHTHITHF